MSAAHERVPGLTPDQVSLDVEAADGLRLHASVHGARLGADVPTVVLAHCWTCDEEDWHYQVPALLDAYGDRVRVVTYDHRGHGRSQAAPEPTCTIAQLARDLGAVVDRLAPEGPLVLAGHSIGGMTLMALPAERPDLLERVAGLLLVSTSSGALDTVNLGLPEAGRLVRAQIPRVLAMRSRLLTRPHRRRSPSIERHVVNRFLFGEPLRLRDAGLVVDQLVACPPATWSGFYRDCMRHERTDELKAYAGIPATVLVGSLDLLTPVAHARRIAGALPDAHLLVAPGAGHMLPLERPDLVSDQLVSLVAPVVSD